MQQVGLCVTQGYTAGEDSDERGDLVRRRSSPTLPSGVTGQMLTVPMYSVCDDASWVMWPSGPRRQGVDGYEVPDTELLGKGPGAFRPSGGVVVTFSEGVQP